MSEEIRIEQEIRLCFKCWKYGINNCLHPRQAKDNFETAKNCEGYAPYDNLKSETYGQ